jgi:hypothetical protein
VPRLALNFGAQGLRDIEKQPRTLPTLPFDPKIYKHGSLGVLDHSRVTTECQNMFQVHPNFQAYADKLMMICTNFRYQCGDVESIREELREKTSLLQNNIVLRDVDPIHPFLWLMQKYISPKVGLIDDNQFKITYMGQQGVGNGVVYDFFSNVMKDILDVGVLVPVDSNNPKGRYMISPELFKEGSPLLRRLTFNKVNDALTVRYVLDIIESVVANCLLNKIPLRVKLSYGLLLCMSTGWVSIDELVIAFFLDHPAIGNSMLNLMKKPSDIVVADLNFNDFTGLEDKQVTTNNFVEYLRFMSYLKMYQTDNMVELKRFINQIEKSKYNINLDLRIFDHYLFDYLTTYQNGKMFRPQINMSPSQLDKLLSGKEVDAATIEAFIARIQFQPADGGPIRPWLLEILRSKGQGFPTQIMGPKYLSEILGKQVTGDLTAKDKEQVHMHFVNRLLGFWSSINSFDETKKYTVKVVDKNPDLLVEAHTCFYLIDVPRYRSKEELFQKLVTSVYGAEKGIGMYGGSKVRYRLVKQA